MVGIRFFPFCRKRKRKERDSLQRIGKEKEGGKGKKKGKGRVWFEVRRRERQPSDICGEKGKKKREKEKKTNRRVSTLLQP